MKIIIVYASAGAGHLKAAEAIYQCIKERCPDTDIGLIDLLEKSSVFFRFSYKQGYSFFVKKALLLWRFAFWVTYFRPLRFLTRGIGAVINRLNSRAFAEFLIAEQPDFVISTHFTTSEIAAGLKLRGKLKSKLITVITDFDVHPFWVSKGTDIYIVASEFTRARLAAEGGLAERIIVSGIPVDPKFLKQFNRVELAGKFGIDKDKWTVLLITGSFGVGPLEQIAQSLSSDVQVLVVCASNKKLYERLQAQNLKNVQVFGFVRNVEELMAVSDMIVTKPGGLSISESLIMGLVPVFIVPIPGQEMGNIKALEHFHLGSYCRKVSQIKEAVLRLKEHPEELKKQREIIARLKKPSAAGEITDVIFKSSSGLAA